LELPDSTSVAYEYDALGRRSSRTDRSGKTTYYVYDSENLVQELDQTGAVKAVYVHSQILDHPLSMNRYGITYYYLYDRLGSVVGLADAAGTLVAKYVYDAWGNIVGGFDGGIENPFRFTAREWDPEVKLYYYRSRYYDPEVGRFIQQDKLGLTGGLNLYVYTGNNPINSIDPFGFDWEDWGEGWLPQVGDFFNGFADALTFGLVGQLHKLTGTSQFVNKCSGSYNAGEWAGIGLSLAFSVAHLGRNAAYQGAKRVISDPRKWGTVRSAWSKAAGGLRPKGQSLHHWLIPQRWAKVNAGFNYLPLTARFNSWMNGSTALRVAVEWGFRGTVLGIYGAPVTVAARR